MSEQGIAEARDRLRQRAQNEATSIALNKLLHAEIASRKEVEKEAAALRGEVAMLRDALTELTTISMYDAVNTRAKARAALAATEATAREYERKLKINIISTCQDAAHDAIHSAIRPIGLCEDVKTAVSDALETLKQ